MEDEMCKKEEALAALARQEEKEAELSEMVIELQEKVFLVRMFNMSHTVLCVPRF